LRLAFGHHEDLTPPHGYEPPRDAAMALFPESGRHEYTVLKRTLAQDREPESGLGF